MATEADKLAPLKKFTEFLNQIKELLTASMAVVGAAFTSEPEKPFPYWGVKFWSFVALAATALLWSSVRWLILRSRIDLGAHPDALRIDPDNPDHFIKRRDDVKALIDECLSRSLVFLNGESGSGKSTLIKIGLACNWPVQHGDVVPLLIDNLGHDWVDGPTAAVAGAVRNSKQLDSSELAQLEWTERKDDVPNSPDPQPTAAVAKEAPSERDTKEGPQPGSEPAESVGQERSEPKSDKTNAVAEQEQVQRSRTRTITAPPSPTAIDRMLRSFAKIGRTPLLIFDQFDDYQTEFSDKFWEKGGRKAREVDAIVQDNRFWARINTLVREGKIKCLFVTRNDRMAGLDAVEFVHGPRKGGITLGRIPSVDASGLIDSLTSGGVIIRPDRGWNQVKRQFLKDLDPDENRTVLPIQLRVALEGLLELRDRLTPGTYRRAGGLRGLEALMIRRHIDAVTTLSRQEMLDVLAAMTDEKDKQKPAARTMDELLPLVEGRRLLRRVNSPEGQREKVKRDLTRALGVLSKANHKLVRATLTETGEPAWVLVHDQLCRPVLEARRRARRWPSLLEDSAKAWEDSGKRWSNLLPVRHQVVFLALRLATTFRYGAHAGYARKSLVRTLPLVFWMIILGGLGWWLRDVQRQASRRESALTNRVKAQDLLRRTLPPDLATRAQALWDLALEKNPDVRRAYLEGALSSGELAERLGDNVDYATHAVVGLDPALRAKVIDELVLPKAKDAAVDPRIRTLAARMGKCLNAGDWNQVFNQLMLSMLSERPEDKQLLEYKFYYVLRARIAPRLLASAELVSRHGDALARD